MLALNRYAMLALPFIASVALFAGCVVESVDTDNNSGTTTVGPGTTTTTGQGGTGGTGGAGGSGGTGGAGGGTSCVDETPQGEVVTNADCDMLNVAPQFAVDCAPPDPVEGPGWRLCRWGVTNLNEGANEFLYERLSTIGVQDACLYEPAQTALNDLYTEACASDTAVADCAEWQTQCGQPITQDVCAFRIGPLNTTARTGIVDCINNAPDTETCQEAFDNCVDNLTNF